MAIKYLDGFAHYNTSQLGRSWVVVNSANISVGTASGRGGLYGVHIGQNSSLSIGVLPGSDSIVIGFAFKLASIPTSGSWILCQIGGSSAAKMNLRIDSGGLISICSGSTATAYSGCVSASAISSGIWHYLEFKTISTASSSSGDIGVQLNGVQIIIAPAATNTSAGGTMTTMTIGHGSGSGSAYSVNFADVAVAYDDDYRGDRVIYTLFPVADGTSVDFNVIGATFAYQAVEEATPDLDTSYISSSTTGAQQTVIMGAPGSTLVNIDSVQVVAISKAVSLTLGIQVCVTIGGTTYYCGKAASSNVDYSYINSYYADSTLAAAFDLNPDTSSAWTNSDFSALEAGVKLGVWP